MYIVLEHFIPQSVLKPTSIFPDKTKQDFQHFDRLFLPGTLKNVPCCLNELMVNFEGNLVGLVDFAGSEFQWIANWPSCDFFIEAR